MRVLRRQKRDWRESLEEAVGIFKVVEHAKAERQSERTTRKFKAAVKVPNVQLDIRSQRFSERLESLETVVVPWCILQRYDAAAQGLKKNARLPSPHPRSSTGAAPASPKRSRLSSRSMRASTGKTEKESCGYHPAASKPLLRFTLSNFRENSRALRAKSLTSLHESTNGTGT